MKSEDQDNLYANLFNPNKSEGDSSAYNKLMSDILANSAGVNVTAAMLNKIYLMRFIIAVVVRLSLIAAVWLFIFNIHLWYGMILFTVLTLIVGGIKDSEIFNKPKE